MRKKEVGQAFILVLILLAIGATMVVPALRLTSTSLKSSQIATRQVKNLYAADAAQEWVLWQLKQPGFADTLQEDVPHTLQFDACGVLVTATIIMRALEGTGGITLATDDVIQPTKTVEPSLVPNDKTARDYTYIITLEQLSENTTLGLDAIYDVLPKGFGSGAYQYGVGNSKLSLDDGVTWREIPDPEWNHELGYLKWPADYDWETSTGAFSSDNSSDHYFYGIRDFTPRQVKMLKFTVHDKFTSEGVYRNWVVLKPWNTLSGATAPITVGTVETSDNTSHTGMLEVSKTSYPPIIPPGVLDVSVEYTITIINLGIPTRQIESITDYLPPGFSYTYGSVNATSTLTTFEPKEPVIENLNGVERQVLRWTIYEFYGDTANTTVPIKSNETLTLTFEVTTTQEVSGLYYNEVIVLTDMEQDVRDVFLSIGVSESDFGSNYSWNTGAVMVPAYDSETETEDGTIIDANMSFTIEGITITSFQFR